MSEIKSVKGVVNSYMAKVDNANSLLARSNTLIDNDSITNLQVNFNSTYVEQSGKNVTEVFSEHIAKNKRRIISMSELFEMIDQEMAGKMIK